MTTTTEQWDDPSTYVPPAALAEAAELRSFATLMRDMHTALTEAGYTDDQALRLTAAVIIGAGVEG